MRHTIWKNAAGLALAAALLPGAALAAELPEHPDRLKYPNLEFTPPAAEDHRVELSNGMVAYLVPDRSLPMVTMEVIMRIGPDLDPAGKEGLGFGMVHLITRSGTSTRSAKELEDRVAFLGASLTSRMGGGGGGFFGPNTAPLTATEASASINLLSKDADEGLQILVDCLKNPGFEKERVELARTQAIQDMKQRNDDSQTIEGYQWSYLVNGEKHWSNRLPTEASVSSITIEDLKAFHQKYVGTSNFLVTVAGDFERDDMVARLEKAFGAFGNAAERPGPPAAPADPPATGWYLVEKDVNQGRVTIGFPGPDRYAPDYAAYQVLNVILGGGGFSSRLVNRIRSDEGLAYSVNSTLDGGVYYPAVWRIRFQSKVRSVPRAMQLALDEVQTAVTSSVTEKELSLAKNLIVQSLPAAFETPEGIAGVLAMEEVTGRYQKDPNYFRKIRDRINAVTIADLDRVSKQLLDRSNMVVLAVGDTEEMLKGDPKYETSIPGLAGAQPSYMPLRDPMTMHPIANP